MGGGAPIGARARQSATGDTAHVAPRSAHALRAGWRGPHTQLRL